jgi:ubiquinone/menaquinone biosynthesis C-methylase UbiE
MTPDEAIDLIHDAVTKPGGTWADLGAGGGTFTRALATLLGPNGTVYAVDRDASSLRSLARSTRSRSTANVSTIVGDFTQPLELSNLDGVVIANALHYVPYPDQPRVIEQIASMLVDGAPLVIIEYDRENANKWVPYPISIVTLTQLAEDTGYGRPVILGKRPSQYGGDLYAAVVRKRAIMNVP